MEAKSSNAGDVPDIPPRPKLRAVEVQPFESEEGPALLLRDPEGITEAVLIVPRALAPFLALFDGRLTIAEMLVEAGRPAGGRRLARQARGDRLPPR